MKLSMIVFCALVPTFVLAANDTVEIRRVWSNDDGHFAFQTVEVPVDAQAKNSCASPTWMGFLLDDMSKAMVGTILSAQARDATVTVNTSGCLGNWNRITSVYGN